MIVVLSILLVVNVITFCVYGIDKYKARHSKWRVSEMTLLLLAALGGSLGAWAGMRVWHHKTLHKKFRYGVPALLFLHVCVAVLLLASSFLLSYSLTPSGMEKRNAESMEFLSAYPGVGEWVDSMLDKKVLRDTFIVNDKGRRLHAFYASRKDAEGTALLSHGYTDNALRMMMLGKMYYDSLRFNILVIEHEHHGKSEGDAIQMGWLDRLNTEAWIDVACDVWPESPIVLHGVSMGAANVMMCSGDSLPPLVKCIVEDCGYTSVWDEFSGEIHNQFCLPVHPLMDIASFLCKMRYGWDFKEASAIEQVRKSTLPMLFIHGGSDTFVPTRMVYSLFEAKTHGYKELWIAEGSEHALSYCDYPEEYLALVRKFIAPIL